MAWQADSDSEKKSRVKVYPPNYTCRFGRRLTDGCVEPIVNAVRQTVLLYLAMLATLAIVDFPTLMNVPNHENVFGRC